MGDFGQFALCFSWLLALIAVIAGVIAGVKNSANIVEAARRALIFSAGLCLLSLIILAYQFLTDDYTNQYVWRYSNKEMFWVYKLSSVWGGMDGSMLLWAGILSFSSAIAAFRIKVVPTQMRAWLMALLSSSMLFFLTVTTYLTNPFRYLDSPYIPPNGNGLNPLLQNPLMAVHPPTLYLGFTTLAIPFAFCMAALIAKEFDQTWIRLSRRWLLAAWAFLTAGIVLGGMWAYVELGWGGFWAWDPVENASFLPWLTATAFLHSVMVQERKGMLKTWNVWLITLTYALTVFGTFLTRSGIVQSVHAFASTDVGWVFLVYLGMILALAIYLTWARRDVLKPERMFESLFSREAAFLVNNLILLSICFATLWGVMFPVFSEAITGTKQAVGIPYFNAVNVPLFLLLLLLMGIGPLIAWKKTSWQNLKKIFLVPFICSLVMGCILVWAGVEGFLPTLAYSLSFFIIVSLMGELHRGAKTQRLSEDSSYVGRVGTVLKRHKTRYGGHLVHVGIAIAAVGITASMAHKVEKEFSLAIGEEYKVGRYSVVLDSIDTARKENYDVLLAEINLRRKNNNQELKKLHPELRRYHRNEESTTEVALYTSLRDDFYLVLAGLDETGARAAFKVFVNPLQIWLWIGIGLVLIGTVIVLLPREGKNKEST
ncbi:MAG: heme lyase CcmF/NrfE family subunit [Bdellovibrionota bacterium]